MRPEPHGAAPPPCQSAARLPRRRPAFALAAILAAAGPRAADALIEELYTTNSVCRERYCINPVFPAVDELPGFQQMRWEKRLLSNISVLMGFCGKFVDYDPAVPLVNTSKDAILARKTKVKEDLAKGAPVRVGQLHQTGNAVVDAVTTMDRAAARRYFTHLSGMGIDAWEHQDPSGPSTLPLSSCARSVARLVCFTFFPQANTKIPAGSQTEYLRPCKNSCENYIQACGVDCCDESLTCVWGGDTGQSRTRETQVEGGKTLLLQAGYADKEGPCEFCTGGASAADGRRSPRRSAAALLVLLGGLAATAGQVR